MNNPFHKEKPKLEYTLPKVCRICLKEVELYASMCAKCAGRE